MGIRGRVLDMRFVALIRTFYTVCPLEDTHHHIASPCLLLSAASSNPKERLMEKLC